MPARVSARTAPTGSLKADSAITVWATFGRRRERTNSGIRIAGSVGDSTAPTSSAADHGRSNAKCAAAPTTAVVRITPGTTSSPRPTHTLRSTRQREVEPAVEQDQRDAEREDELRAERLERDVHHVEDGRTEGGADQDEDQDLRHAQEVGEQPRDERRDEQQAQRQQNVVRHASESRLRRSPSRARRAMSPAVSSSSTITSAAPRASAIRRLRAASRSSSKSCSVCPAARAS